MKTYSEQMAIYFISENIRNGLP